MPHDFAKQRADRANRSGKPPAAPWLWLLSGMVIGGFCSFLFFLTTMTPRPAQVDSTGDKPPVTATATPPRPAGKPQFDFYDLLSENEVATGPHPGSSKTATKPSSGTAAPTATTAPSILMLQAGSFRQPGDADRRRGEITLLGYAVSVASITLPVDGTWHRVQVGPFASADDLNSARRALLEQGIDTRDVSKRGE